MKTVMISIQPKWCELIANGKKTIEVRKARPKIETPFKCYIYCTKVRHEAIMQNSKGIDLCYCDNFEMSICFGGEIANGKVIGEFICDKIEDFSKWQYEYDALLRHIDLYAGTSGDYKFLHDYLKGNKQGYGWHISDLKIYDKPKELNEFYTIPESGSDCCIGCEHQEYPLDEEPCKSCTGERKYLYRPPQSWCYVKESE